MEEKRYLTVSALTKYIKYKFDKDAHLKNVLLKGEISNFKHHSRGHFYFTLKDDKSQISAIMFASSSKKVIFTPKDGMSILVEGYITVYEANGGYQIYVNKMSEDGLGDLYLAYEQLKKKLSDEGLFDGMHKQPIPRFPKRIAVLTSPTGAAVRDIINIVNRRFPVSEIIVYPTLVQGPYAKDNIVENIRKVNSDNLSDVIILGRGGGSIEDLWPFNEELVAYEIFKSKVPIISSVGHETDFTISDFVADLRAPTPSGGAELAVPNQDDLFKYLRQMEAQNELSLKRLVKRKNDSLNNILTSYIFRDPLRLTEQKSRKLDHIMEKLDLLHPGNKLKQSTEEVVHKTKLLNNYYQRLLEKKQNNYLLKVNKLELVNPLSIMKKGYSLSKVNGKIIKTVKDVKISDKVDILVNDGIIETTVINVREEE
ncbi:Exodeoxyribonuclease 7 large subunit [Candidatus Izimaplasma bacterium HR1]|jgi:exodeoxyribonuclease VII large subunit|uniref:exodeoxyribonuclease VII large subunit n=1 Tax=Candidatus Izimoplasma sp. HR1 TaxID=1541959 RepID=UPI0004F7A92E|nr:Exodeoxyribonuclease 7 large subunit [Candidatus Izimaplasma bacterium HR1]